LVAGGREFPCHRGILALCSHYFHAMFSGDFTESIAARVELKEVDPGMLETLIDFAYTGKITINQGNVEGLMRTSSQLHFKVCSRYLRQQMDATNCLGICEFGESHGCPEVSSKAWSFLQENFEAVSQQEEFLQLSKERLAIYLSNDQLQVQEEQSLAEAVLRWVRHDPGPRAQFLPELLELAHLVSLPEQYLQNLLATEPLVRDSDASKALVARSCATKNPQTPLQKLEEVLVVVGGRVLEESEDEDGGLEMPAAPRNFAFYNPKSRRWMALPDFPDYNKWGFSLVALNNDVYVTGGSRGSQNDTWSTTQAWRFCPKDGAWKPIASMLRARTNHTSAVLNGEIYVIGGTTVDAVEVERYDPYNKSWCAISPALKYVSNFAAASCLGKLYLVGSCAVKYNALTLQCYNPVQDLWSVITSPFIPKYLSAPRCATLHGLIYLIGDNTKKVHVYNPEANIWQKVQLLHTLHENGGMVPLGDRLFVTGGHWKGMDGDYRVEMEVYDCTKNLWTREGSLPCLWLFHSSSSIFLDTSKWTEAF
ncbi:Kelch-like 30, partial [Phaethon lepturus]